MSMHSPHLLNTQDPHAKAFSAGGPSTVWGMTMQDALTSIRSRAACTIVV